MLIDLVIKLPAAGVPVSLREFLTLLEALRARVIHFHMLFLDGVYVERREGSLRFRWVKAPTSTELTRLAHRIAQRVGRFLERQGLLERDAENS